MHHTNFLICISCIKKSVVLLAIWFNHYDSFQQTLFKSEFQVPWKKELSNNKFHDRHLNRMYTFVQTNVMDIYHICQKHEEYKGTSKNNSFQSHQYLRCISPLKSGDRHFGITVY